MWISMLKNKMQFIEKDSCPHEMWGLCKWYKPFKTVQVALPLTYNNIERRTIHWKFFFHKKNRKTTEKKKKKRESEKDSNRLVPLNTNFFVSIRLYFNPFFFLSDQMYNIIKSCWWTQLEITGKSIYFKDINIPL